MKRKTRNLLLGLSAFTVVSLGIGRLMDSRCGESCIVEAARANAGADWSKLNKGPFNFNYRYSSSDDSFTGTNLEINIGDDEKNPLRKAGPLTEEYKGQGVQEIRIISYVTRWDVSEGTSDKVTVKYRRYLEAKEWTVEEKGDRLKIELGKKGPLDAELILPKGYQGNVSLSTVSGDLEVLSFAQARDVSIQGVSADMQIKSAPRHEFAIQTVSGDVNFQAKTINPELRFDYNSVSGDAVVSLEGPLKELKGQTVSGDFELNVPETVGFNFDLETVSGSYEGFAKDNKQGGSFMPKSTNGSFGAEPRVRLEFESISGDLKLIQK